MILQEKLALGIQAAKDFASGKTKADYIAFIPYYKIGLQCAKCGKWLRRSNFFPRVVCEDCTKEQKRIYNKRRKSEQFGDK